MNSGEFSDPRTDEIDLMALVTTLWRGKYLIALCTVLTTVIGLYYALAVAVPMYPAQAVIALEDQEQNVISDIESVFSGAGSDQTALNTETAVLKSRILISRLVDQLNLVADPEFAPEPVAGGLRVKLGLSEPRTLSPEEIRNLTIDSVLKTITISNPRQSLVFNISVLTEDRDKSALMANTLADIYIESQLVTKFETTQRATAFLSERAAELGQTLEGMEIERNAFFERDRSITPEALAATSAQLRDLRERMSDLQANKVQTAAQLELLEARIDDPEAFASVAADARLTQTLRRRGADDPLMRDMMNAMLENLRAELLRFDQQVAALSTSEAELDTQVNRQSAELIELQQLERELEATRILYESVLTRLKETNIQQGLERADSRLLSSAVPRPASSPRIPMIGALSLVLGLLVGAAIVLVREMRFSGFRTPDDLQNAVKVTALGSVPVAPGRKRKDILGYLATKPNSVVAESIRNLRTSILMSNPDKQPKVILLTSSVPAEGKTTLSMALARNLQGLNKKVLLIEADIRRRTFTQYFDTSKSASLMQALQDPGTLTADSIHNKEIGMDVLVGNKSNANAADIFASQTFADLIDKARDSYDYIVIDSPPVLAVSDARVIAPLCDAVVYVVHWNKTTKVQVKQGLQMFASVGIKITGLVLSKVDSKKMRGYGYGGEYGYDAYKNSYYDN